MSDPDIAQLDLTYTSFERLGEYTHTEAFLDTMLAIIRRTSSWPLLSNMRRG